MQIWDTIGQETFKSMNKMYFRGVHAVIFVCDLCDSQSLHDLDGWIKDFVNNSDRDKLSDIAFLLLGNKNDVANTKNISATAEESSISGSIYTKNRGKYKGSTATQVYLTEDDLERWSLA